MGKFSEEVGISPSTLFYRKMYISLVELAVNDREEILDRFEMNDSIYDYNKELQSMVNEIIHKIKIQKSLNQKESRKETRSLFLPILISI